MTIRPEDISDEAFDEMNGDYYSDFGMDKEDFAAILNAAIEAGVVSPPCYQPVVDGEPLTDVFGPTIFATQQSVEEWFVDREICRESWGGRHWKGQTE
jgi:hypothetical protein